MDSAIEEFRGSQGTQIPTWLITVPVLISHQTLFPQELPSVELSAQVWTQLAQGANPLSIPDCVILASGLPCGVGLLSHLENSPELPRLGRAHPVASPTMNSYLYLRT